MERKIENDFDRLSRRRCGEGLAQSGKRCAAVDQNTWHPECVLVANVLFSRFAPTESEHREGNRDASSRGQHHSDHRCR